MKLYELNISKLRLKIDKLDENIVELLNKRFAVCVELAVLKKKINAPIIDLHRQREVLNKVKLLSNSAYKKVNYFIFLMIIYASINLQLDFDC